MTRFADSIRTELSDDDVNVTVLHLGPIDTDMWDRLEAVEGNQAALKRGKKLRALSIGSVQAVAEAAVDAVRTDKREVRIPKNVVPAAMMTSFGTRMNELVWWGIGPSSSPRDPTSDSTLPPIHTE